MSDKLNVLKQNKVGKFDYNIVLIRIYGNRKKYSFFLSEKKFWHGSGRNGSDYFRKTGDEHFLIFLKLMEKNISVILKQTF